MRLLSIISVFLIVSVTSAQPIQGPAPAPQSPGSGSFLLLRVGGGFYLTGADLAKGFPQFASMPAGLYYKSGSNITVGINHTPFWGNRVNYSNLFGDMLGPSGEVIDQNGFPTVIRYYMRGSATNLTVGKLLGGKGGKSGQFELALGAGFMQHFVKMRFDVGRTPQLEGDYAKGYDRLTNGLQLVQHFRWHYLNPETISVFAGLDVAQGFTQNRRGWNFADGGPDNSKHFDFYSGLSAGIIIPLSLKASKQDNPKYFE
jgi:hypothetical protein